MQLLNRQCVRVGVSPRAARQHAVARPQRFVVSRAAKTEEVEVSTNGATASNGHATSSVVEFDELSEIIRLVHDTDIVEFELKSKRFSLSVKKKEALRMEQASSMPMMVPQMIAPAPMPVAPAPAPAAPAAPAPAPAPAAAPAPAPAAAPKGIELTSPMAGTFYRKPAPGEPAFCKEGDRIQKGQTVCIIEAMKLMNEIEAESGGEVVKFLLENGQPVSIGQPIMIIKP